MAMQKTFLYIICEYLHNSFLLISTAILMLTIYMITAFERITNMATGRRNYKWFHFYQTHIINVGNYLV